MFSDKSVKYFMIFAALSGFMAISLGAFAAHALKAIFNEYQRNIWQTAVFYQMIHTLLLLWVSRIQFNPLTLSCMLLLSIGILLFSGSLYLLAYSQIKWLGAITPIGGLCLLLAWLLLAISFFKQDAVDEK